ncbi:hypothetical protein FHS57_005938 [Runella defluvii]|uniref:DUF3575 domain-containing protein n=1 Tax=Runella defluvii TaxID=370973 RepID=A0A7W5ZUC6_9BACT|nr:hypothetical protein [Runella defluvii]MBB3841909.1 hypothetical protein [Runella defluvii]
MKNLLLKITVISLVFSLTIQAQTDSTKRFTLSNAEAMVGLGLHPTGNMYGFRLGLKDNLNPNRDIRVWFNSTKLIGDNTTRQILAGVGIRKKILELQSGVSGFWGLSVFGGHEKKSSEYQVLGFVVEGKQSRFVAGIEGNVEAEKGPIVIGFRYRVSPLSLAEKSYALVSFGYRFDAQLFRLKK